VVVVGGVFEFVVQRVTVKALDAGCDVVGRGVAGVKLRVDGEQSGGVGLVGGEPFVVCPVGVLAAREELRELGRAVLSLFVGVLESGVEVGASSKVAAAQLLASLEQDLLGVESAVPRRVEAPSPRPSANSSIAPPSPLASPARLCHPYAWAPTGLPRLKLSAAIPKFRGGIRAPRRTSCRDDPSRIPRRNLWIAALRTGGGACRAGGLGRAEHDWR